MVNYVIKVGLATEHGELRHQGQASNEHGELFHQGRASTEHGELRHQVIGLALSMENYLIKIGLALSMVNYHIKDRGTEHDGLCHGDRADGKQPELLQRDRAGFDGGDLHHGRGQGQGLCGGQGHGQDHGSGGYPPYPGVEQSGQGSKLQEAHCPKTSPQCI